MTVSAQPASDLGILVLLAYQGFVRQLHKDMAAHGYDDIGHSDGVVFRMLARQPHTVSELATWLEISKQGTTQIIDDMQARGYVVRTPDPSDARAKLIALSPRGQAALSVARRFHRSYEARLVRAHGSESIEALRVVLGDMGAAAPEALDRALRGVYL
jgi:DNA-binding MarR family transcriptional regulator